MINEIKIPKLTAADKVKKEKVLLSKNSTSLSASPPPPGSVLTNRRFSSFFSFTGPRGVGKTTIVEALREHGALENILPLVTTRKPRVGEENTPYYIFISEQEFADRTVKDEFIECETLGPGTYYGLLKSSVEDAIRKGGRTGIVAGFDISAYLKTYLQGKEGVIFRSILFKPADESVCDARIAGSGIEVKTRLKEGRAQRNMILSRENEYNQVIINAEISRAIEETKTYLSNTIMGKTLETTPPPTIAKTPQEIKVWLLYRRIWSELEQNWNKLDFTNMDTLEQSLYTVEEPLLRTFMSELYKQIWKETVPVDKEKFFNETISHTLDVYASALQAGMPYNNCVAVPRRTGKLNILGPVEKAKENLDQQREVANSIRLKKLFYALISHDLGKLISHANHPEKGFLLLKETQLLEQVDDFDAPTVQELQLISKYHVILGTAVFQMSSYLVIPEMLEDPEVRNYLSDGKGGINISRAELFFRDLAFYTSCDVAGSYLKEGILRNSLVEGYKTMVGRIIQTCKNNASDYDVAIAALKTEMANFNWERLANILGVSDLQMDDKLERSQFYWKEANRVVAEAIQAGSMEQDKWQSLVDNFHLMRHFLPPELMICLSQVDTQTGKVVDGFRVDRINPGIYKLLSLIADFVVKDYQSHETYLDFIDSKGQLPIRRDPAKVCAEAFMPLINQAKSLQRVGEKVFFINAAGAEIAEIQIEEKQEANKRTLVFKLLTV